MVITEETRQRIIQLLDEGKTYRQIQKICGVSSSTVQRYSRSRSKHAYATGGDNKVRYTDNEAQRKACLNCIRPTCRGDCDKIRSLT